MSKNFDLNYGFLRIDVRMVSIIHLRCLQSLLQLVHLINFKKSTHILEVGDRKIASNTSCWKEKDRSAACVGKTQQRKKCELKECVLIRYSFHRKLHFGLEL